MERETGLFLVAKAGFYDKHIRQCHQTCHQLPVGTSLGPQLSGIFAELSLSFYGHHRQNNLCSTCCEGKVSGNKHGSEWEGAVTSIPSKTAAFPVALAPPTYVISWSPPRSPVSCMGQASMTAINLRVQVLHWPQFPPLQNSSLDRNQESIWRIASHGGLQRSVPQQALAKIPPTLTQ